MSKIFVFILICFIAGCSKKRDELSDIKIEQVNPPRQIEISAEQKQDVKIEEQTTEQTNQTSKPESVSTTSKSASKNIGKNAAVKGYVADVFKNAKVAYLNFDGKFPKNSFSAVVFKGDFSTFGDLNRYRGKTVEVSGIITEYKGKPQIILKDPSQLKIVN